jgi:quercetin dioxygenase-like cupin family protein
MLRLTGREPSPNDPRPRNPFHKIVLAAGAALVMAACSYSVVYVKQQASGAGRPVLPADESPWWELVDRHGGTLLATALVMLAAAALADFLWEYAATQRRRSLPMKVCHYEQVESQVVDMPGAQDCRVRWLIGSAEGAPTFAMRQFEVLPGGHTPRHSHPYEHEVFVLEGQGVVYEGDQPHPLQAGDVVYVKPDQVHQFRNTGSGSLKFLCLVPNSAAQQPVTMTPECGSVT